MLSVLLYEQKREKEAARSFDRSDKMDDLNPVGRETVIFRKCIEASNVFFVRLHE